MKPHSGRISARAWRCVAPGRSNLRNRILGNRAAHWARVGNGSPADAAAPRDGAVRVGAVQFQERLISLLADF